MPTTGPAQPATAPRPTPRVLVPHPHERDDGTDAKSQNDPQCSRERRPARTEGGDYLTIDTEGSELSFVEDFPWTRTSAWSRSNSSTSRYKAQRGRQARITAHMRANGFELQNRFVVQQRDTFDLIYVPKRDFRRGPAAGRQRAAGVDAVWAAGHSVYVGEAKLFIRVGVVETQRYSVSRTIKSRRPLPARRRVKHTETQ